MAKMEVLDAYRNLMIAMEKAGISVKPKYRELGFDEISAMFGTASPVKTESSGTYTPTQFTLGTDLEIVQMVDDLVVGFNSYLAKQAKGGNHGKQ